MGESLNNRILVLDDEPGLLDAYRMILEPGSGGVAPVQIVSSRSRGGAAVAAATTPAAVPTTSPFQVTYASTGEQALTLIQQAIKTGTPFAGGFFDVKLGPGIDGIETIRRARDLDPRMLFVVVTAYQDRTIDEISRIFGAEFSDRWDFLSKPFSSNEILQKGRNLLSNWDRREKIRLYLQQIEQQQKQLVISERLAAIGTLARGIGHEFGNILNRIMGMSELALAKKDTAEMESTLKTVVSASERAGHIVRNLQSLVRMQTERSKTDIHEPLRQALALVQHEFKKSGITLKEEYQATQTTLHANRVELGQVFLNLLINAVHAMEGKAGTLTVHTDNQDGKIRVAISDTGSGITPENMPHLFEPLFTTKGDKGSGIGLSVSKKIITNHGGTIAVQSAPGKDTTFTITLPSA